MALLTAGCFSSGPSGPPRASVSRNPGLPLPRSFFGFSVEYPELPHFEQNMPAFERILRLWRITGNGPQVIRVGGDSADVTYWNPVQVLTPANAYVLTPKWFATARRLILQANLRVILDLNLHHSTAALEAAFARKALAAFPPHRIIGFEVGNEPDRYRGGFTPATYATDLRAYAAALSFARRIPLLAPAVTNAQTNIHWLRDTVTSSPAQVGALDGHRYLLGGCDSKRSPHYPTIARLLSDRMTSGLAASVRPAVQLAHSRGKPFRLGELGSVNCGGIAGVSNTFATALWAPDALFSLWAAGLNAVNIHIRSFKINGPLLPVPGGFIARPLAYGLALFARAASPGGRLIPLEINAAPIYHLRAWGVETSNRQLHVLLIDKGRVAAPVQLTLKARGPARIQRLLAPSVSATSGVTLAGQAIAPDGRLTGRFVAETIVPRHGIYTIPVPAGSAVLVTAPAK
ncbi:MAG: glycosyl hydrolase family 79 C-terminal domain-containing protein [Solirubrobacteraceae bacterium]